MTLAYINLIGGLSGDMLISSLLDLGLDEKMWANAIQKAIEIPEETLIENANHIINMCSSKIIDAEYLDKINGLINNKY